MLAAQAHIDGETEEYLLNVSEQEYLDYLVSEYQVYPLEVDFGHVEATDEEQMIPAEEFPPTFNVSAGRRYPKPVFTFYLPFTGAPGLWGAAPNPSLLWNPSVALDRDANTISIRLVQFSDDVKQVNTTYLAFVNNLKQQLANMKGNVDHFNISLRDKAKQIFDKRKAALKKKAENRAALIVPVRRNKTPATFAVPVKSPKRIVPKPPTSANRGSIDPTLDPTLYHEILQLLHDFGKQMERLPATYRGKDEETLRDHVLLLLQPHFGIEGSVTGETFNAQGKTDILIRYQNQNLFIAEFKFWRGQKQHFETIDQLLSYLTWRDSKAAIVYFIDGKEMTAPLAAIEQSTPEHRSFISLINRKEDSWFQYELHLQSGEVSVQVAILCFHLPK